MEFSLRLNVFSEELHGSEFFEHRVRSVFECPSGQFRHIWYSRIFPGNVYLSSEGVLTIGKWKDGAGNGAERLLQEVQFQGGRDAS